MGEKGVCKSCLFFLSINYHNKLLDFGQKRHKSSMCSIVFGLRKLLHLKPGLDKTQMGEKDRAASTVGVSEMIATQFSPKKMFSWMYFLLKGTWGPEVQRPLKSTSRLPLTSKGSRPFTVATGIALAQRLTHVRCEPEKKSYQVPSTGNLSILSPAFLEGLSQHGYQSLPAELVVLWCEHLSAVKWKSPTTFT